MLDETIHECPDDFPQEQGPEPEPVTHLPSVNVISQQHEEISSVFLRKVSAMINGTNLKVMDYSVKRARGSWDSNDEVLSLELGDGRKLVLKIETKGE